MMYTNTRKLALIATVFTFFVIILGAKTRLTDAGLGCPDWPGCYGYLTVPKDQGYIDPTVALYQERALEKPKAWMEMIHRYVAGILGLMIAAIAFMSWKQRKQNNHPVLLPTIILLVVTMQAALGAWTVTMKLNPSIVMLHLLGGFTTFSLLFILSIRLSKGDQPFRIKKSTVQALKPWAIVALVVTITQIALGGWTSANYAAEICNGWNSLPICQGNWYDNLDFKEALRFWGFDLPPKGHFENGHLEGAPLLTIHVMHRFGAIVTLAVLGFFGWKLRQDSNQLLVDLGTMLWIVLGVQILLGVNNVVFQLPLWNAIAHNAVGALLLITVVGINYVLYAHKKRG